ncbi:MAG: hypothetical protein U9P12_02170, partial [Verrucomicrobiota bacterium]|nr:hypothetical protein [Verrucomicrobiota bacterium]
MKRSEGCLPFIKVVLLSAVMCVCAGCPGIQSAGDESLAVECSPLERVWGNYYEYALDVEINETPEALFAKIGSFFNEDGAPTGDEFYRVMNPMLSLVQLYQSP